MQPIRMWLDSNDSMSSQVKGVFVCFVCHAITAINISITPELRYMYIFYMYIIYVCECVMPETLSYALEELAHLKYPTVDTDIKFHKKTPRRSCEQLQCLNCHSMFTLDLKIRVSGIEQQRTLLRQVRNLDNYIDSVPFYSLSTRHLRAYCLNRREA